MTAGLASPTSRRVVIPIYPGIQPLDVAGPHEVFDAANRALDHLGRSDPRYSLEVVAARIGVVRGPSGLGLAADGPLPTPGAAEIDILLIPGGDGARDAANDSDLVGWISASAAHSHRVATVCSGTFVAAAAGLCDGRRVTTHWSRAGELALACPSATVEPDAIFVTDGPLWTSAGVTAGIDLALALVEADNGGTVAQLVARHLVVHLRRPGGQTQYASPVWSEPPTTSPIAAARDLIHEDPAADLGIAALADRVGMSERHFTRTFRAEIGEPPARYIERVRIDCARHLLDQGHIGLDEVARQSGFGTSETLRRAFNRRLGCSPDAYRRRFAAL